MKIVTIIGARPQFVKAATVSRVIQTRNEIEEVLVHTGQHYDENMSRIFFDEMEMPEPGYNLGVGSGRHGEQTGKMLAAVEDVLIREQPDWVLIYGDTNSTLAGSIAAIKLHIPIAHVEAGLRSYNREMPEEINRLLSDHVSTILFAPTVAAVENLRKEGIRGNKVYNVGDVMYDAALFYGRRAEEGSSILENVGFAERDYILTTVHRAENTDKPDRLRAIVGGIAKVAENIPVIWPMHPRTLRIIDEMDIKRERIAGIEMINPVGYLDMVMLEKHSRLVATDSGGVQKEAFFHRVPCVTLRNETEWVELVELGWNRLVFPESQDVVAEGILAALDSKGVEGNPYGEGDASEKIVATLDDSRINLA